MLYRLRYHYTYADPRYRYLKVNEYYTSLTFLNLRILSLNDGIQFIETEQLDFEPTSNSLIEVYSFYSDFNYELIGIYHDMSEVREAFKDDLRTKLWEFNVDVKYITEHYRHGAYDALMKNNNKEYPLLIVSPRLTNTIAFCDPAIWE